jgi:hypothetical protein
MSMPDVWDQAEVEAMIKKSLGLWNEWAVYTDGWVDQATSPGDQYARGMAIRAIILAAVQSGSDFHKMTSPERAQIAAMAAATVTRINEMASTHETQKIMDQLVAGTLGES